MFEWPLKTGFTIHQNPCYNEVCCNGTARYIISDKIKWTDQYKGSTLKPVVSGRSKIDKTKILMTNGSLMKVESIAECSLWSILQYF